MTNRWKHEDRGREKLNGKDIREKDKRRIESLVGDTVALTVI